MHVSAVWEAGRLLLNLPLEDFFHIYAKFRTGKIDRSQVEESYDIGFGKIVDCRETGNLVFYLYRIDIVAEMEIYLRSASFSKSEK